MVKKLFCVILIACSFIVLYAPTASAGIGPSPFKIYLAQTIQQIIQRLNIMNTPGTAGAGEIIARLEAIADPAKNVTNVRLAKNTLGAMDRITAVFFAPQPEPPKVIPQELVFLVQDALDALDELITLGFETPPEMISLATESSQLLDRFTARLFAPQPEPPKVASVRIRPPYRVEHFSTYPWNNAGGPDRGQNGHRPSLPGRGSSFCPSARTAENR